jgi:molecular chaperone DnaK
LKHSPSPSCRKTRANCLRSLSDAKLKPADLDDVILVGGQTRMPMVRALVREIFAREPNTSANPDEAVALGATIQAGILEGGVQNMVLLDVTPLSLGIETFGGLMNIIIPRNTTIPTKAGELFTTAIDNQKSMKIQVLQGERELARDNWSLGTFELEFAPAPKGVPRVGVQFEIDANGILSVLARDVKTGHQKIVQLKSAVDVRDEDVEKMVAESVEYAFDDMAQRQWIETKRKSGDMLGATRKALAQVGALIVPEEVKEIEALMHASRRRSKARTSTNSRPPMPRSTRAPWRWPISSWTWPWRNSFARRACSATTPPSPPPRRPFPFSSPNPSPRPAPRARFR